MFTRCPIWCFSASLQLCPPADSSCAPVAWFRYAVRFVIALRRRGPQQGGEGGGSGLRRWDPRRARVALRARQPYIAAYRTLLEREAGALTKAGAAGLQPAALREAMRRDGGAAVALQTVAEFEAHRDLPLETLLDMRLEARLEVEAARAVAAAAGGSAGRGGSSEWGSSGGGWLGWLMSGATPVPAPPHSPTGDTPAPTRIFDVKARRAELEQVSVVLVSQGGPRLLICPLPLRYGIAGTVPCCCSRGARAPRAAGGASRQPHRAARACALANNWQRCGGSRGDRHSHRLAPRGRRCPPGRQGERRLVC